ncbi:MAG: hypothetical protein IJD58_08675 [Lachnospiraceae bacterium]|nr:hypothetical protein [Lachnospiraceae bacterium]
MIKDMFSVNDFVKIIKQILEKHNIDERELKREYIKVQDIDKYNPKIIKRILKDKNTPDIDLLGYKGVITCNEMNIKFRNGQEWFVYRDGVKYEPVLWMEHIYSNPEVELSRRCTEEYPEEIVNDELFKYFREIYKLFDKYYIKLKKYMEIIYKELDKYPCNSVAIRMGESIPFICLQE